MRTRLLLAASLLAVATLGCSEATAPAPGTRANLAALLPSEPAYITGTVIDRGSRTGRGPSVLVATNPRIQVSAAPDESGGRSAHVVLGADVVVVHRTGRYASVDELQPGRVVTVWSGPIEQRSLPPIVSGRVLVIER